MSLTTVMLHKMAFFFFLTALATGSAQEPADLLAKAPPDVDAALRTRISQFYQAHVDGKFRLAYDLVADDSKDLFFAADKDKYSDFSILTIQYSEEFTKAKAVVACGKEVATLGNLFKVKAPLATTWKLVGGQWYWYTVPVTEHETPFGVMRPGPKVDDSAALGKRAPRVEGLRKFIKLDKTGVKLSLNEPSSDQVIVTNDMPGPISLSIHCPLLAGLEANLDRTELNAKEKATVSFRFDPSQKGPRPRLNAMLVVAPLNYTIPIEVLFFGNIEQAAPPAPKHGWNLPQGAPPLTQPAAPAPKQ